MKIEDLPHGTKFIFCWYEASFLEHIGTVGVGCSCGLDFNEVDYETEVYPILEWEEKKND